jgi:hypothetical protein
MLARQLPACGSVNARNFKGLWANDGHRIYPRCFNGKLLMIL